MCSPEWLELCSQKEKRRCGRENISFHSIISETFRASQGRWITLADLTEPRLNFPQFWGVVSDRTHTDISVYLRVKYLLRHIVQKRSGAMSVNWSETSCKIEVCNHEPKVLVNKQVFWLNVSVDHANLLVQVLEAIHELLEKISDQWLRKSFIHFH